MKEYFSQFGDVSRLRLARNRKVGVYMARLIVDWRVQALCLHRNVIPARRRDCRRDDEQLSSQGSSLKVSCMLSKVVADG